MNEAFTSADGRPHQERPTRIHLSRWEDEVVERHGFDPAGRYALTYWLPILGPSTVLMLRRFHEHLLDAGDPVEGIWIDTEELGRSLGLGTGTGRNSPLWRSLDRCAMFGTARRTGIGLGVRRRLPPLPRRFLARLPEPLVAQHDTWITGAGEGEELRFACRVSWLLLEEGRGRENAERSLIDLGFRPATAVAATDWAERELTAGGSAA